MKELDEETIRLTKRMIGGRNIRFLYDRKFDETDFKIAKYRWEILRRNSEFRKDYNTYRVKEQTERRLRFPNKNDIEFSRKWKLGRLLPLNLEQSFDDFLKGFNNISKEERDVLKLLFIAVMLFGAGPIASGEWDGKMGIISIEVNLNYSKNAIEKKFKKDLNYWKCRWEEDKLNKREEQERIVKMKSPIPTRKEFKHYDKYFKIWDMRNQFPKPTFEEIGKIIYPQKPKKQAKDLAIQNYYAAYKLIYDKKYVPENIRREIKKEDLAKVCSKCEERYTCKHLCPSVLPYYLQDEVKGGRQLLLSRIDYTKQ